jgi:hypothetical protein
MSVRVATQKRRGHDAGTEHFARRPVDHRLPAALEDLRHVMAAVRAVEPRRASAGENAPLGEDD